MNLRWDVSVICLKEYQTTGQVACVYQSNGGKLPQDKTLTI